MNSASDHPSIQAVAQQFATAWASPSVESLGALLHPSVTLRQPNLPPLKGKEAALKEFEKLLTFVPGIHGEVERSVGYQEVLFIEWKMIFPFAGNKTVIRTVDRIIIQDGLIYDRTAYFDQTKLMKAILTSPSLWWKYIAYRR